MCTATPPPPLDMAFLPLHLASTHSVAPPSPASQDLSGLPETFHVSPSPVCPGLAWSPNHRSSRLSHSGAHPRPRPSPQAGSQLGHQRGSRGAGRQDHSCVHGSSHTGMTGGLGEGVRGMGRTPHSVHLPQSPPLMLSQPLCCLPNSPSGSWVQPPSSGAGSTWSSGRKQGLGSGAPCGVRCAGLSRRIQSLSPAGLLLRKRTKVRFLGNFSLPTLLG